MYIILNTDKSEKRQLFSKTKIIKRVFREFRARATDYFELKEPAMQDGCSDAKRIL